MAYDSDIRRLNIILKQLGPVFTIKDFMKLTGETDLYTVAKKICDAVLSGYLKQIVRVTLSSGEFIDYKSIIDIPGTIFDVTTGQTHIVVPDDISIYYSKV